MYLVAVGLYVAATRTSSFRPPAPLNLTVVGANLAMVHPLLGQPTVVGPSWTLGVELAFYVAASALFVAGLLGRTPLLLAGTVVLTLGLASPSVMAAHPQAWTAAFWAVTFAVGMVCHHADSGALPGWAAPAALGIGVGTGLAGVAVAGDDLSFATAIVLGYALFAGALASRSTRWPRVLVRVGLVSYSIFLTHELVIHFVPDTGIGPVSAVVWLVACVAVAELGYRLVEDPGRRWGRRLAPPRELPPTDLAAPTPPG